MEWFKCFNARWMMLMALLATSMTMVAAQNQVTIDIVILLNVNSEEYKQLQPVLKDFSNQFNLDLLQSVGMAMVHCESGKDKIWLNLTATRADIETRIDSFKPDDNAEPFLPDALAAMQKIALSGGKSYVWILVNPPNAYQAERVLEVINKECQNARNIYVLNTKKIKRIHKYACHPVDVIETSNFKDGFEIIKNKIIWEHSCQLKKICLSDATTGECKAEIVSFTGDVKQCNHKAPEIKCEDKEVCRLTCDHYWPWKSKVKGIDDCDKACGMRPIERLGDPQYGNNKFQIKIKESCLSSITCEVCTADHFRGAREAEDKARVMIGVIVALVFVIIGLVILSFVGCFILNKKRAAEQRVEEQKMEAVVATATNMSMYVSKKGKDAGANADLPSLVESTRKLKGMMKEGAQGASAKSPGASIKSGKSAK